MDLKLLADLELQYDSRGLIPAIVQDAGSGQVLMVAWMTREALQLTIETGEAHFWSRSRQTLWHKGATSGNIQKVVEIRVDCDADTLLLQVDPAGPACHTGETSCFYRTLATEAMETSKTPAIRMAMNNQIDELYQVLVNRKENPQTGSYTNLLLADNAEIAKKIGEEAIEVILAAASQGKERIVEETADLIYHTLVLLVANDLSWDDVLAELERRRR